MNLELIIQESIKLELNVSDLYMIFYKEFSADSDFWWTLTLEEKNHASLLRRASDSLFSRDKFPEKLLVPELDAILKTNEFLEDTILKFNKNCCTREEAFNLAYTIENSACEIHYQENMEEEEPDQLLKIFQQLNKEDKNHSLRIKNKMKELKIEIND